MHEFPEAGENLSSDLRIVQRFFPRLPSSVHGTTTKIKMLCSSILCGSFRQAFLSVQIENNIADIPSLRPVKPVQTVPERDASSSRRLKCSVNHDNEDWAHLFFARLPDQEFAELLAGEAEVVTCHAL